MTAPRKKCDRCYGHMGAHSPFCSYHHKNYRVVGVSMHAEGMVCTYASGFRSLETADGTWINLDWWEHVHGVPYPEKAR